MQGSKDVNVKICFKLSFLVYVLTAVVTEANIPFITNGLLFFLLCLSSCILHLELNDFIIQLDEEVEGMQSTILVLQQQLKETRQQLSQHAHGLGTSSGAGPSRTAPSPPSASEPPAETETAPSGSSTGAKDCGQVFNGPSNGSSQRALSSSGPYQETSSADEDYPGSPCASSPAHGGGAKLSNHSEGTVDQGTGGGYGTLSAGYESVDSPTGSEASMTQHSNDTDSNTESHEATAVAKSSRTAGAHHTTHNGLDSAAAATTASNPSTGSVL